MSTNIPELKPITGIISDNISIGKINLYLVFNIFLVIFSGIIFKEVVLSSFIMESFILVLTIVFVGFQGMDIKAAFRLKIPGIKEIGLTLITIAAGIYVASFIDQLFRFYIQNLGTLPEPKIPQPENIKDFLLTLAAIALFPALAEEALFRGLVLTGYQKFITTGRAVFISALFFGMAHLSISNFWGPFILGLLCGWLVCRTDSIFPAIIAHFFNNGLTLTVAYFDPNIWESRLVTVQDLITALPTFIIAGVILLLLLLHNQKGFKAIETGKEGLGQIFKHWSTWIFITIFGLLALLEFL